MSSSNKLDVMEMFFCKESVSTSVRTPATSTKVSLAAQTPIKEKAVTGSTQTFGKEKTEVAE